jgi:hypothetical protein
MKRPRKKRDKYFQTVARYFLERRGAPFYLSSQEFEVIEGWEKTGIPVQIVLQGIEDSFRSRGKRPSRKGRFPSLAYCQPFVLKALEAYKEKRVGENRKLLPKKDKKKELKRAVSSFMESCPEELQKIKQVYSRLQKRSYWDIDEQMLEALDQEVEALLIQEASAEETERIREEVSDEFRGSDGEEFDRILDLKLARYIRKKYKIPYLSLFYY